MFTTHINCKLINVIDIAAHCSQLKLLYILFTLHLSVKSRYISYLKLPYTIMQVYRIYVYSIY